MTTEWVVVVEAATGDSTPELDEATLSRVIDAVSDAQPVALCSADRYAVQLLVTATNPTDALWFVLRRWSEAVSALEAPEWEVVRAEVITLAEFELEFETANRRAHMPSYYGSVEPLDSEILSRGDDLASELRWRLMLQDSHERLMLLSEQGAVSFSLPPLEPGLLLSEDGRAPALTELVHPDDAEVVGGAIAQLLRGPSDTVTFVARLRGEDGWRSYQSTARNLLDEPLVRAIVVNGEDVTRQTELEDRVAALACQDELTGLVNRATFLDFLELALARSEQGAQTAVFFVDIDDFRTLVGRIGAEAGDRLLVTLADRMRTGVRDDAVASRLGRDEFALLCAGVDGSKEAAQIAKRVADLLSGVVVDDGEDLRVTVSVGVALGKAPVQAATLLRHAEVAMYRARRGRERYEIFRRRRRLSTGSE